MKVEYQGEKLLINFELQAKRDPKMGIRLLRYSLEVIEETPTYQRLVKKGELLSARRSIEIVAQARFPKLLPQVRERIEQIDDLEKLQEILQTMSTARTAKSIRE